MTAELFALSVDARDPLRLGRFWAELLRHDLLDDPRLGIVLLPRDDAGFLVRFRPTDVPKVGLGRLHLHLTSRTPDEQRETVTRTLALGGQHLDVGQLPEEEHVVLADPEGNEFCVIEAGNAWLRGCDFLGELACDGSPEVGRFWSEALGWPLVWDQDGETAIRSPDGGFVIAWGGPPVAPKAGQNRLHLDLVPADGDVAAELARLRSLGATTAVGALHGTALADPEGNELCLLSRR